ncbi:MAG: glycosyltransferase family 39 protein, partial [Candidatus Methylomirabilis sp.]
RVPLIVNVPLFQDETEHLHAAWAIAHGQVLYRDFWQLHPPLLYYLLAPLFPLMGEDLRVIYVARGLMLLCLLLILRETYRIATRCFDARTGLLAVLLLSYLLLWWRPAYDVRPDIPQTWLVLLGLHRFMQAWGEHRRRDFLLAGALLGVALWFLLKTLFPLVGLTLVFALSVGLRRSATALRRSLTGLLLFSSGVLVPVLVGVVLLWLAGAWPGFWQWGVIGAFEWPERFSAFGLADQRPHVVSWTLAIVGVALTVSKMIRARVVDEVRLSPLLAMAVTAGTYLFLIPAPWRQSALPLLPIAAMYGADVIARLCALAFSPVLPVPDQAIATAPRLVRRLTWMGLVGLLLFGICGPPVQAVLSKMSPLSDQWADRRQIIEYVLALTSPEDSIFDSYALYIFRPHASYYYVITTAHVMWLWSGLIRESDIMNDLRRNHCKVAIFSRYLVELPPNLLRFLQAHYVSTRFHEQDRVVLVAGRVLKPHDLQGNRATISLIASAEYTVRVQGGEPRVYIDGASYQAPLFLEQGEHQVVVEGRFGAITIFYAGASKTALW